MASHCASSFLTPGPVAHANAVAVLHLKRDLLIPVKLEARDDNDEGYAEGKVTNTRFGSFPHSTLIGLPWGTQVRASAVDTGSRGRRGANGKPEIDRRRKRVEEPDAEGEEAPPTPKAAVTAATGFVHLLPPTPESWTTSLPHRTQVVYTPDYSYILHRLRVRPGSVIIEAGAGSGSFTHAAARAVFDGYQNEHESRSRKRKRTGKVWSYEFHEQRVDKLKTEIREHGLDGIVQIEYRDVCQDGFLLSQKEQYSNGDAPRGPAAAIEPQADAIFLDLPAPWLALRHLTRSRVLPRTPDKATETSATDGTDPGQRNDSSNPTMDDSRQYLDSVRSSDTGKLSFDSPLDPRTTVRLCTFSPCIEQVQRTISTLRQLGWLEVEMVEIAAKRVEIRRERVGLHEEGLQGVNASPASVTEAVKRLREIEGRFKSFHDDSSQPPENTEPKTVHSSASSLLANVSKQQRLGNIRDALPDRKLYKEGRLVHRAEQELKTHTSYLVFALLPREWMAEDEENCHQRWAPKAQIIAKDGVNMSRRQMKRAAKFRAGGNKVFEQMEEETTMTKSLDIPQNDQVDKAIEPLIDTTLFTA